MQIVLPCMPNKPSLMCLLDQELQLKLLQLALFRHSSRDVWQHLPACSTWAGGCPGCGCHWRPPKPCRDTREALDDSISLLLGGLALHERQGDLDHALEDECKHATSESHMGGLGQRCREAQLPWQQLSTAFAAASKASLPRELHTSPCKSPGHPSSPCIHGEGQTVTLLDRRKVWSIGFA